ncbi:MAG: homocysteine S-methyltransferase family protein [Nannocystaceae bacterium]|nr:homocysteine S-methyltransferase family protein [Nannocystaceae bacterium]
MPPRLTGGPTGTELARRGFSLRPPSYSAAANLEVPALVEAIAADWAGAGATLLTINSTCAHRHWVGDAVARHCEAAAALARAGAPKVTLAGSLAMLPASVATAQRDAQYRETAIALVAAGVDVLLLEAFVDVDEAARALGATAGLHPRRWLGFVPLAVPERASLRALAAEVECLALHCCDTDALSSALDRGDGLVRAAYPSRAPTQDHDAFAAALAGLARRHALSWVGCCCGGTPQTLAALGRALA